MGAGSQRHYARLLAGRRLIWPADKAGLYLHRSTKRAISVFDEGPLTSICPLNCPSLISDQRRQHNSASRHCARSRRLTFPRLLHCSLLYIFIDQSLLAIHKHTNINCTSFIMLQMCMTNCCCCCCVASRSAIVSSIFTIRLFACLPKSQGFLCSHARHSLHIY